ncbi:MAG: hypothetical protein ACR2O8_09255 [Rhizobiaceae bacterium]
MTRHIPCIPLAGLLVIGLGLSAHANEAGMLELGKKPEKETILAIGSTAPKKKIELDLGALRTDEATLPPAPLTRSERMALRARLAVSRQKAVSNARRRQPLDRSPVNRDDFDQDIFAVDENGEPIME